MFSCTLLFAEEKDKDRYIPKYSIALLSENGEEMMTQCSRPVPENIKSFFDLTADDILILENNLKKNYHLKLQKIHLMDGV